MDILEAKTNDGRLIGKVGFDLDSDSYSFEYSKEWVASSDGYPISPSINFESPASSATIKRFIENLLPEGKGLDAVAHSRNLSKSNAFALMRAVGHECAGAIMFVPIGYESSEQPPPRRIDDLELMSRINDRSNIPFSVWDGKVRMSIAGYQDKIAVFVKDDEMFLVGHPLASTHILKPLPERLELSTLVANEHFCMRLAAACGLRTANSTIKRVPHPVLVVERFDRRYDAGQHRVDRTHIIDACQLIDLPPAYKYEQNFGNEKDVAHIRDGASLKKIFSKTNQAEAPFAFKAQILRWVLFQYLIGNADAHGKNLSFYVLPGGKIKLTPAYDMVSTAIYQGIKNGIAMSIGDEFTFGNVSAYQWASFAVECGIPIGMLATEMRRIASSAARHAATQPDRDLFTRDEMADILRIQAFVMQQAASMVKDARMVKDVDMSELTGRDSPDQKPWPSPYD